MSHTTVRRRTRDGLIELVPNTIELTRAERYAVIFAVVLVSKVLFLSALIPVQAHAVVLGCCLAAELAVLAREAGLLQPPKAPVHVLTRWRPSGPGPLA